MTRGSRQTCKCIVVGGLTFFAGCFFAAPACAEQDFEYAKALIEHDEPSFGTDDLVERFIAKLLEAPTSEAEGKLIKATYLRRQAGNASAEKKNKLLVEADKLYKDIVAGDKKYRNYGIAERESTAMTSELIKSQIELAGNDKVKARELRSQAAANMETIASGHKVTTDANEPKFKDAYAKYQKFVKDMTDPESGELKKQYPSNEMDGLMKSFDDWIVADKRYVAAKVEQIQCYDDSDPTKKTAADEMAKYCDAKITSEILGEFPVLTSWYSMMQGRIYALVNDEDKAGAAWVTALGVDVPHLNDDQRKQMFLIKKIIIHDLIKMNMKSKKYAQVEENIAQSLIDPVLRTLFDDDSGKDLLIDYAKALTFKDSADQNDVEKAVKKLRDQIEKENAKGGAYWAFRFSRAMAEILDYARSHKPPIMPHLQAPEWYEAARGYFDFGQNEFKKYTEMEKESKGDPKNKDQFEKAYNEFQNAVDFYRRAVSVARAGDTLTRVTIEPKAWFEMGLCYLKMNHYYEAVTVYQAMRNTFLPEFRGKWLPDAQTLEKQKLTKAVKEAFDELDKADTGLLAKSGRNVLYALDENKKIHKAPTDLWNKSLAGKVMKVDNKIALDSGVKDLNYNNANGVMDEARGFADNAKTLKDKAAEDGFSQAVAKYLAAADAFGKIPASSDAYEFALFKAGICFNLSQSMWVQGRMPSSPPAEQAKQAKDLGAKGLKIFDDYLAFVAKAPAKTEEDKTRRKTLEGEVLLARNSLSSGSQDWKSVLQTSDDYLKWAEANPVEGKNKEVALTNKFLALIELGAMPENFPPKNDQLLKDAETTMRDIIGLKPKEKMTAKDKKLYRDMLNEISKRFNIASYQVEKFLKDGKTDVTHEMQDEYEDKVAQLALERVEGEESANEEPLLEDYSRLVYLFDKASRRMKNVEQAGKMEEKSAEMAGKLLEKFDTKNKNLSIPEEKEAWQPLLAKMIGDGKTERGLLRVDEFKGDITRLEQCKRDHATLVDYMYDTVPGDTPIAQRPDYDKLKTDLEKAKVQLKTIKDNYPTCATLADKDGHVSAAAAKAVDDWIEAVKGKYPDIANMKAKPTEPKAPLQIIEEEIDYRRKIEATRDLLVRQSLDLASKYAANEDLARKWRGVASDQIKILGELRGETPAMREMSAGLDIANGKYKEAEDTLWKIADEADKDSDVYFKAKRRLSEIFALQKPPKWSQAAEFPEYIALVAGPNGPRAQRLWPGLDAFLEECYKNGAPRPAALKLGSDKKDDKKTDDKKPDEPKTDGKKVDEKKADEPKADEKKAADEKKE